MRKPPTIEKTNVVTALSGALGESVKHESASKHVSGSALYTDDIVAPQDLLHAYPGLSTIAHGKVKRLDLSKVLSAPGVVDVLMLSDVPGHTDIGPVFPGDALMVNEGGVVEFSGQVLFAVVATSYTAARFAARQAIVEYEAFGANVSISSAYEQQSFVRPSHTQSRGDVNTALAAASNRCAGELSIGGQEHMYLEGQVSLAVPNEDQGILLYTSSQNPTEAQKLVAEVLNIPMNLVAVDIRRMGGGFGGKETSGNQWACLAALLARKTGRAVKMRLSRADDILATGKRHHFDVEFEVGFNNDGIIEALTLELKAGCGMSPDLSDAIVDRAMFHSDNAYFIPAMRVTGHRVKTNTVSNVAFRGFGGPQGVVAIENVIEQIAETLKLDPLVVRQRNFYRAEDQRDTTHYGQKIENHIIADLVTRLEQQSEYSARRTAISLFNQQSTVLKKGIALTPVKFGISFTAKHLNQAGALIHIYPDGSIHLNHGGTEMGQGLFTKIAQVVASEFQVDIEKIHCTATRSDKVPNSSPTAASSGSDLNGMAARNAASKIKQRFVAFAVEHFEVEAAQIRFQNNSVYVASEEFTFEAFSQLAYMNRVSLSATGFYKTPKIHYDRSKGEGRPFFYFAYGAAISEVIIDTLTGESKVQRVDICHDVGQSMNPALDIGQIEGAFIQGMGWLTSEELVWNEQGQLQTINPASYKIPAIGDTPEIFNVELLPDSPNVEATIFHSKAVGEPPFMLATSVWAAIRHAISSLGCNQFRLDTPATPERILMACNIASAESDNREPS